ncbi:unnamed protein product [Nippostrongylus brasiliensis]|uniref:Secreted protein n=1 Tax=Nippostrongylus brasiliensis TaxID=27835 RepID=A0A0N4YX20_NIPBR|nr:unnamed protein product [Nippostrongylus brasiliensis]
MLSFTLCSTQYQRFYMPTSFLCTFLICLVTLLIFSSDSKSAFMTPVASLATSFQVSGYSTDFPEAVKFVAGKSMGSESLCAS